MQQTKRTTLYQAAGLLSLGLLLQIAISYPLWFYNDMRVFPTLPIMSLDFLAFDLLNFILLSIILLGIMFLPHQRLFYLLFTVLIIVLLIQDTLRFQLPFVVFSFMLVLLYFNNQEREQQLVQALGFILIGTYFWAGIHQLTPFYIYNTFPNQFPFSGLAEGLLFIAYIPSILALLTSITLFIPKFRKIGLGLATAYHVIQLILHLPFTHWENIVLWIWHITTICLIFLFFTNSKTPVFAGFFTHLKTFPIIAYVFLIFGILPIFHLFVPFHDTLALNGYTSNSTKHTFYFHEKDRYCLPLEVEQYIFSNTTDTEERKIQRIELNDWVQQEFGVSIGHSSSNLSAITNRLCSCLQIPRRAGVELVKIDRWTLEEIPFTVKCPLY